MNNKSYTYLNTNKQLCKLHSPCHPWLSPPPRPSLLSLYLNVRELSAVSQTDTRFSPRWTSVFGHKLTYRLGPIWLRETTLLLKSRGQGPKKMENKGTNLSRTFNKNMDLVPWLENNHTLKWWSGIFLTILTYIIMLENCQNNILVCGCSPIQGTKFYSC